MNILIGIIALGALGIGIVSMFDNTIDVKRIKVILGSLVLLVAGLVFYSVANADHNPMESAGPADIGVMSVYKDDITKQLKIHGQGGVMKGAIEYADNLTTCTAYWSVAVVFMTEAAKGGAIPLAAVHTVRYYATFTGVHLTLYSVALEKSIGSNKFNASSFLHAMEQVGGDRTQTIIDEITGGNRVEHNNEYIALCSPIVKNMLAISAGVVEELDKGVLPNDIEAYRIEQPKKGEFAL